MHCQTWELFYLQLFLLHLATDISRILSLWKVTGKTINQRVPHLQKPRDHTNVVCFFWAECWFGVDDHANVRRRVTDLAATSLLKWWFGCRKELLCVHNKHDTAEFLRRHTHKCLSENWDCLKRMVALKLEARGAKLVRVNRGANAGVWVLFFFCLYVQGVSGFLELVCLDQLFFVGSFLPHVQQVQQGYQNTPKR